MEPSRWWKKRAQLFSKIPFPFRPLGRNSADFSKVFPRLALFAREIQRRIRILRFRFLITWRAREWNNEHCSIVERGSNEIRRKRNFPHSVPLAVCRIRMRWRASTIRSRKIKRQCAKSGEIRRLPPLPPVLQSCIDMSQPRNFLPSPNNPPP